MARIFRYWVEAHPSNEHRPQVCFEAYFQLGQATPNRLLHFGIAPPIEEDDIFYVCERIEETLRNLMARNLGGQRVLEL